MQSTKRATDEKILPILRSGSKIAPTDVEEVLRHNPAVLVAGVMGMPIRPRVKGWLRSLPCAMDSTPVSRSYATKTFSRLTPVSRSDVAKVSGKR
jgi:hypothetical protein